MNNTRTQRSSKKSNSRNNQVVHTQSKRVEDEDGWVTTQKTEVKRTTSNHKTGNQDRVRTNKNKTDPNSHRKKEQKLEQPTQQPKTIEPIVKLHSQPTTTQPQQKQAPSSWANLFQNGQPSEPEATSHDETSIPDSETSEKYQQLHDEDEIEVDQPINIEDPLPVANQQQEPEQESNVKSKKKKKKNKKASNSAAFEGSEILDLENLTFSQYEQVHFQPRGLNNVRNSCYMNSVLQSLLYIPSFYNLFIKLGTLNLDPNTYPLTCRLIRFVSECPKSAKNANNVIDSGASFTPEYIFDYMIKSSNSKTLKFGEQHDAHEFLMFILETIHEELKNTKQSMQSKKASLTNTQDDSWQEVGTKGKASIVHEIKYEESPISKLFSGRMRSLVKKRNVRASLTLQPFYSLHLPIQEDRTRHVLDSIKDLTHCEHVVDSNLSKQISLEQVPQILILQLERFAFELTNDENNDERDAKMDALRMRRRNNTRKIMKHVQFDEKLYLDANVIPTGRVPERDPRRHYELMSVVCHHGKEVTGGHYTTYVKHSTGKWLHLDDTLTSTVTLNKVLDQDAYLLIYHAFNPDTFKALNNKKK
ncbi:ubiquitin carboxyl-terminal hydrolase [Acrasis kona]|uniref:ubiquitinyl hydrolase 1 n=1 Tax=Acrasis kona TaxID=1008807 RepID=A0AAW2YS92_9EUKA